MGACCSSDSGSNQKQLNLYLEYTGIYEVDELFRSAAAPLKTLDDVNKSLSKDALAKATFTYILNNVQLIDAIEGMLNAYAAETDGDLKKLDFKIDTSNPYIGINRYDLPFNIRPISDAWDNLVTGLETAPEKLREVPEQLRLAAEEAKDFPDRAKNILSTQNVGPMEMIKVGKKVSDNVSTILNAPNILEKTNQTIAELKNTMMQLKERYGEEKIKEIEALGKKAKSQGHTAPRDLVTKYWPDLTRVNLTLEHKN